MICLAQDQSLAAFAVATYNAHMHRRAICPGNYDVDFDEETGKFTKTDGYGGHGDVPEPREEDRPTWVSEARQYRDSEEYDVYFSTTWNTYVLIRREM